MRSNNFGFHDKEFERILVEYRKVINIIRNKAIIKYGRKAARWFPDV